MGWIANNILSHLYKNAFLQSVWILHLFAKFDSQISTNIVENIISVTTYKKVTETNKCIAYLIFRRIPETGFA